MDTDVLNFASDAAFARLKDAGGDLSSLSVALRTFVMVYSAQGIIDNGGLEYFYLKDFDGQPAYDEFVEAYARIGASSAANCIDRSSRLFGISDPHMHEAKRELFLMDETGKGLQQLKFLSDAICRDASVWECLCSFVAANRTEFDPI
ncbi:DMP19 family protein [Dyella terrae]|uniref:DMP19 family protein n=1 Tax=Dyella terrae TaxID=522259 RepID=UPI001EFE2393|nr:DUF4375 domain-containing protein [Dyella terrae]ULU25305.1 DUF4375 protein [Dyella terrae]